MSLEEICSLDRGSKAILYLWQASARRVLHVFLVAYAGRNAAISMWRLP
jgi:hypothetical protein